MPRKWIWHEEEQRLVAEEEYRAMKAGVTAAKASHLPRPYIRTDGMSDTWNPADGRHYDSKSAYEAAVKAAGCEIVGNDPIESVTAPKRSKSSAKEISQDVKTAYDQVDQGMEVEPLMTKEEFEAPLKERVEEIVVGDGNAQAV